MKKLFGTICAITMMFAASHLAAAPIGKITLVLGKVEIREGGGAWQKAKPGMAINPQSEINTGIRSQAMIAMATGTKMKVESSTMMKFSNFAKGKFGTSTDIDLRTGKMTAFVNKLSTDDKRNHFRVRTPTAVAGVRGSIMGTGSNGEMGFSAEMFEHAADAFTENGRRADIPEKGSVDVSGDGNMTSADQNMDRESMVFIFDPNMSDEEAAMMFDSMDPFFGSPDDFEFLRDLLFDEFYSFGGETVEFEKL